MRNELKVDIEERDYAKQPLSAAELGELFKGRNPLEFLNSRSPAFKKRGLDVAKITPDRALRLMAEDPNLIKRPLVIAGNEYIAGFDRDRLKKALG